MKKITTNVRVRYAETDKMGFVYYGNYAQFFEVGRTEMFRQLGFLYSNLEDEMGTVMPVVDLNCKFLKPAFYDDLLEIHTWLNSFPEGVRLSFSYEIYRPSTKDLLVTGSTTLVFMNAKTYKIEKCPEFLKKGIREKLF